MTALFIQADVDLNVPQQDIINQVVDRVNDFNRRIRDLEEKIRNMNARVNTLDESLLNKHQELEDQIQEVEDEIGEIRDRLANLEVDVKELNREKRKFVTEQNLDEIENYIELMNPINSGFVTKKQAKELFESNKGLSKEEVEDIIDRKLKNQEKEMNNEFE